MRGAWLLAFRYISHYRGRTCILIAAVAVMCYLPLATHWTIERFEQQLFLRSNTTPLVVGKKGSRFALAMHALYFRGEATPEITRSEIKRIADSQLAHAIPIFARFRTQGIAIVGTSTDYYRFRNLRLGQGGPMQRLGDCVVGAGAARKLEVVPGDRLLSEPENLFDLSGPSPLNMRVTGILQPSGSPDDDVVWCDLKTTWIIAGIGHGHSTQPEALKTDDHQHAAGRENMQQFTEVTDDNEKSFHFHGSSDQYPLTAIIVVPNSVKAETLLMGRYLSPDESHQIIRPVEVVQEFMDIVVQVRQLFDAGSLLLSCAALLLLGLVLWLSTRLRQREMRTMFLLGSSRGTLFQLIAAELAIVLTSGVMLAVVAAVVTARYGDIILARVT